MCQGFGGMLESFFLIWWLRHREINFESLRDPFKGQKWILLDFLAACLKIGLKSLNINQKSVSTNIKNCLIWSEKNCQKIAKMQKYELSIFFVLICLIFSIFLNGWW